MHVGRQWRRFLVFILLFPAFPLLGATADLRLEQTLQQDESGRLEIVVTVTNDGPDTAVSTVLDFLYGTASTNFVPPGEAHLSAAPAGCEEAPNESGGYGKRLLCTMGDLASGAHTVLPFTLQSGVGSYGTYVSVSSTTPDPLQNNSANGGGGLRANRRYLEIEDSPDPVVAGGSVTYTITLSVRGFWDYVYYTVDLSLLNGEITEVSSFLYSGRCSGDTSRQICQDALGFPMTLFVTAKSTGGSPMVLTASLLEESLTVIESTTVQPCTGEAPVLVEPPGGAKVPSNGFLTWSPVEDAAYSVYLGPPGSGCNTIFGTATDESLVYLLDPNSPYEWRVEAAVPNCPTTSSPCTTFAVGNDCAARPTLLEPYSGMQTTSPVSFQWSAVPGATTYRVFTATGGAPFAPLATTTATTLTAAMPPGPTRWYVSADVDDCPDVRAGSVSFEVVTPKRKRRSAN